MHARQRNRVRAADPADPRGRRSNRGRDLRPTADQVHAGDAATDRRQFGEQPRGKRGRLAEVRLW